MSCINLSSYLINEVAFKDKKEKTSTLHTNHPIKVKVLQAAKNIFQILFPYFLDLAKSKMFNSCTNYECVNIGTSALFFFIGNIDSSTS